MEIIRSKYDNRTYYKVMKDHVTIIRDGESIKLNYSTIKRETINFIPEIQAELMAIYKTLHPDITCPVCGKAFEKVHKKKYCSVECRIKASKPEVKQRVIVCEICGKEFEKNGCRKYCSTECAKEAKIQAMKIRNEKQKAAPNEKKKKKDPQSLSRLTAEARAKGISYGQLQAEKFKETMRW